MGNELSEERRRLIYRYKQDSDAEPIVASEKPAEVPTVSLPQQEVVTILSVPSEPDPWLVPMSELPSNPWRREFVHLRHRLSRGGPSLGNAHASLLESGDRELSHGETLAHRALHELRG